MCNDDYRPAGSHGIGGEELHDRLATGVIERRRGLVTHDEARFVHERSRNRDPLLLASGQRDRQRGESVAQTELYQEVFRASPARRRAMPAAIKGTATFSAAVNAGSRLNC
jgi:hypothetical protein